MMYLVGTSYVHMRFHVKQAKDVQYKINIPEHQRDAFLEACKNMDTTGAQEIRKFIRNYIARNGQKDMF